MSKPIIKLITYNREDRDFSVTVNGVFLGCTTSYLDGETLANQYVYNLLTRQGITPTSEAAPC